MILPIIEWLGLEFQSIFIVQFFAKLFYNRRSSYWCKERRIGLNFFRPCTVNSHRSQICGLISTWWCSSSKKGQVSYMKMHSVELRSDCCLNEKFPRNIDIQNIGIKQWKKYLKMKENFQERHTGMSYITGMILKTSKGEYDAIDLTVGMIMIVMRHNLSRILCPWWILCNNKNKIVTYFNFCNSLTTFYTRNIFGLALCTVWALKKSRNPKYENSFGMNDIKFTM